MRGEKRRKHSIMREGVVQEGGDIFVLVHMKSDRKDKRRRGDGGLSRTLPKKKNGRGDTRQRGLDLAILRVVVDLSGRFSLGKRGVVERRRRLSSLSLSLATSGHSTMDE